MNWQTFRAEFPVVAHWAFLDHAAVAPLSQRARQALVDYADDLAQNGTANYSKWLRRLEEVRKLFGQLLHADPLDIAFVKNTSEGVGLVAEGFPWQAGDNVVTSADEYPANVYPWLNLADRGVEVRRVPAREGRVVLDDLAAALDCRTRLITLSFVEYATGFRNDLDAVGMLCRERGILLFVDAIQGLGVFPLDVSRTPIDFLAADGHKWLLGPEGAGILYIRREQIERLRPIGVGWNSVVGAWDFGKIHFHLKPHAGRYESGSPNIGGISALGASLELLLQTGIENLAARILELTDHLVEGARRRGLDAFSSRKPGEASGIVSFQPKEGRNPADVVRRCRAQGVIINHRGGRLRVSPHAYNTVKEIDRLLGILGETQ
jgi:selenocysteine lyase/cysteine desulfurase